MNRKQPRTRRLHASDDLPDSLGLALAKTPRSVRTAARRILDRAGYRIAPGPPSQVHLSVTGRCFMPCRHCDMHRNNSRDLPTRRWFSIVDRLAHWLGTAAVNFVGGEPLMRRDLETIMARSAEHGFQVSFNTNGWLLTPHRARRLMEAGTSIAYISLDGVRESTVDHSRGRKGAFRRAIEAMENLERLPSPRVVVACILHGGNAREISPLLEMLRSRGHQLVVQALYQSFGEEPFDPSWYKRSILWPRDPAPVLEALDMLIEIRLAGGPVCNSVAQLQAMKAYFQDPTKHNGLSCRAGHSDLAIDPRGNLLLCFNMDPVGNVFEPTTLDRIWIRPATMKRRWQISRCKRTCNLLNCNFSQDGPL